PALVDSFADSLADSALPLPWCLPVSFLPSVSTIFVFDPDNGMGLAVAPDLFASVLPLPSCFRPSVSDLALRRRQRRLLLASNAPGHFVGVRLALPVRLPGFAHDDLGL